MTILRETTYPKGLLMNKNTKDSPTIVHMLYDNEQNIPNDVYLRQPIRGEWHEFTWQQTMDMARRLVTFFKSQGLQKGDRVSVLSKNCAEWFISDFAIMMAGLVSVPLYATQQQKTIRYVLEKADVKMIIIGKLDEWARMEPGVPDGIIRVKMSYDKNIKADHSWDDILKNNEPTTESILPEQSDVFSYIFTSGTTGNPKGVVMTYLQLYNLLCGAEQLLTTDFNLPDKNRYLSYLPLAHIFERVFEYLTVSMRIEASFVESLESFAKNLQEVSPTIFAAVPRIWNIFKTKILEKLPQKKLDLLFRIPILSSLIKRKIRKTLGLNNAICVSGAAALPPRRIEWFEKLGIHINQGYGATENFALVSAERPGKRKLGSVGKAFPHVEFKLADDNELLVKSKRNMQEYYQEPEATAKAITNDGYWHTGDLARIDEDGYLFIIGRTKDTFKTTKGEFIHPEQIELNFSNDYNIETLSIVGSGLRQPILIVQLSEMAKRKNKDSLHRELEERLSTANKKLATFEKVSHIFITNSDWTIENEFLTPTLKVKRYTIQEKYQETLPKLKNIKEKIIWEKNL